MVEIRNGNRKAILSPLSGGRWTVWVGFFGPDGAEFGALWFKGFRTCGNDYASEKRARAGSEKVFGRREVKSFTTGGATAPAHRGKHDKDYRNC
jgi:hypothetical protein